MKTNSSYISRFKNSGIFLSTLLVLLAFVEPTFAQYNFIGWGYNGNGQISAPPDASKNMKAISSGYNHMLALKENGTVVSWGENSWDQAKVPQSLMGVKAIAAGFNHSLALKINGTAVTWGGSMNPIPAALTRVKAIAAGNSHSVFLKENGKVLSMGRNNYGESSVPSGLDSVKAIAAGAHFAVALRENGSVVAWGINNLRQTTVPATATNIQQIAAMGDYTLALKISGTVVAWGSNSHGQTTIPVGLSNIKAISAGETHALALKEDGTVVAWGSNFDGESSVPTGLTNVKAIAAGIGYSMALKEDGTIVAWGTHNYGLSTIPSGFSKPHAIAARGSHSVVLQQDSTVVTWGNFNPRVAMPFGLDNVKAIAAGDFNILALKFDGNVVAWGTNNFGECNIPLNLTKVKAIAAGNMHMVALLADGTVTSWGSDAYGQGTPPAGLDDVKAIDARGLFTVALRENGTVVAWGSNYAGQCNVPSTLTNVTAISAGAEHVLALKEDGTVVAWGSKGQGRSNVPAGLDKVIAISAGGYHSVALRVDGTVVAWGYNQSGQIDIPAGLANVKAIAGGGHYTLALYCPEANFSETNLPTGAKGILYNYTLSQQQYVGTVSYQVEPTHLPKGLSLDSVSGIISGIPDTTGFFTFNVKVSDGQCDDLVDFTIIVDDTSCTPPVVLKVDSLNNNSAYLSWSKYPSKSATYAVASRIAGGTWRIERTPRNRITLDSLYPGVNYEWMVRKSCGIGLGNSAWSEVSSFTTPGNFPCPPPSALVVSGITSNTAQIDWIGQSTIYGYDVHLRKQEENTLNIVPSPTSSYTLSALEAGQAYAVRVRQVCNAERTLVSKWVFNVFSTPVAALREGITDAYGVEVFPNPTSGIVRIVTPDNSYERLQIVNSLGNVVHQQEIQLGGTKVDLRNASKGLYILQLKGTENTIIRKIVIE